jgi:U4/U6.U5 tri-snRNP-associated protein 2
VNVLRKFDGVSFSDVLAMQQQSKEMDATVEGIVVSRKRRYRLKKLPNYLILHLNRFKHNNFTVEKNPTIVMFPVKNFDLSEYVFRDDKEKVPTEEDVKSMSVSSYVH